MITVYHAPLSRSCRVLWLLEELGLDYRVEGLEFKPDSLRSPAYLAKNPMGRVPTIEDTGGGRELVIFESGAILQYVLETYGEGRLQPPLGSPERAPYLQWFHFAESTALPPLSDFIQHRFLRPEEQRIPAVVPDAATRIQTWLGVLETALDGRDCLVGDTFSAADIMMGYSLHLANAVGQLGPNASHTRAYYERLSQRPAFQKAFDGVPPEES